MRGGNAPRQVPTKEEGRNGRGGQGIGFVSTYIDVNWKLAIGERGGYQCPFQAPRGYAMPGTSESDSRGRVDVLCQPPLEDT